MRANQRKLEHGPLKEFGKQKYRRYPLITRVTQHDGQTTYWRSVNISEGGIFVQAAPSLPVGTETEIGFFLPTSPIEVVTRARVMWTNTQGEADYDASKPYGMGLMFLDLKADLQVRIRNYVETSTGKTGD